MTEIVSDQQKPAVIWEPTDYPGIGKTGNTIPEEKQQAALKLATSAIAPLVATARGYHAYNDPTETRHVQKMYGVDGRSKDGAYIKNALQESDLLFMPWYTINDVLKHHEGHPLAHTMSQIRPGKPTTDKTGRARKYLMPKGSKTIIGLHPATPTSLITNPDTILITEGLLKADAALSGYLIDCGVPLDELTAPTTDDGKHLTQQQAITKLSNLIDTYCTTTNPDGTPTHRRIMILSLVGVGTWHKNATEWNSTPLNGRDAWVAFDGDIAENPNVWVQAKRLTDFLATRGTTTIDFIVPTTPDGEHNKLGIDDYLALYGDFNTLTNQRLTQLPPQPPGRNEDLDGKIRLNTTGTEVIKYEKTTSADGVEHITPRTLVEYGGRITSVVTRRQVTDTEARTGTFGAGVERLNTPMKKYVNIDVSWHPRNYDGTIDTNDIHHGTIIADEKILNYTPDAWARHGANIDTNILLQPDWPPRHGREFATAMREASIYGEHKYHDLTEWLQMGWVPQEDGDPVFIVGDQIVAREGNELTETSSSRPGLPNNPSYGPMSSRFGFGDFENKGQWEHRGHPDGDAYRQYARNVFTQVIHTYLQNGVWPDKNSPRTPDGTPPASGIAPLVVGAGLRPCIPLKDSLSVYFSGTAGSGKSWSAAAIIAFWQREPGSFGHQKLPGSANDTFAYTEDMIHHFPLWVIDDLAPTPDKLKAQGDIDKMEKIVRSKHNANPRGRAKAGDDGITPQDAKEPRALLIITAENDLSTDSAMQRTLPIPLRSGGLGDRKATQDLVNMREKTTLPSELSAIVVKYIQWQIECNGWEETVAHFLHQRDLATQRYVNFITSRTGGQARNPERAAHIVADVIIALELLGRIAMELDLDEDIIELFDTENVPRQIEKLIGEVQKENKYRARGWNFIDLINRALLAGHCYVVDHDEPNIPPIIDGDKSVCLKLGWAPKGSDGAFRPSGACVGTLRYDKASNESYIAIDYNMAFSVVKKHFSAHINETDVANTVRAVHDEGLLTSIVPLERGRNTQKVTTTQPGEDGDYDRKQRRVIAVDVQLLTDPDGWRRDTGYDTPDPENPTNG